MTQAVQSPYTDQHEETDRRWFQWQRGVVSQYIGEAQLSLLDFEPGDALDKFLFDYGLACSRRDKSGDAEWFVQQMPSEGPASYFSEEHAEEMERFVAQLKGEEHLTYTPEQLRAVASACLAQAKELIDLAQEITSGKFSFPEAHDTTT